ncbi:MAG: Trans-aconitate 2-methyltransferase [Syntrophomonadaceae bacterium]|nr:Trans-aconitate 2-methyltransferase [Bacillota bacterium]
MSMGNSSKEIFKGTAHYYSIYRPGIPSKVVEYVAKRYGLNGKGVLLDMGCGTGQSTFALAPLFEKTVAFDVDIEMLFEAKQKAPRDLNIEWQQRSDKDISDIEGPYRLAVACRSFHWMEQYPLLKKLHNILEPGGGVAIIGDGSFWTGDESWQKRVKEVIQSFLGQERRAGQTKFNSSVEPFSVILENSNYFDVQYKAFPIMREWDIQSILGYLYSTSFSAKHLYGDRLQEFEDTMKEQLIIANNGNLIFVEHNEFVVQSGVHK